MKTPKLFVDTNIVLDWLGRRAPFYEYANALFRMGEQGKVELLISTVSFVFVEYALTKQLGLPKSLKAINALRQLCSICENGPKEIDLSLSSPIKDFEDAFQYYTALNNGASVIITRNAKDFSVSSIPVMSAEEYVKTA